MCVCVWLRASWRRRSPRGERNLVVAVSVLYWTMAAHTRRMPMHCGLESSNSLCCSVHVPFCPFAFLPTPAESGGMMRKRSSSGSSGSSSRVQRSTEVMPHQNYPQQQPLIPPQVMHHGGPGGAVAAAGRLVRQTSRDSNDGSLHSVSSESSS